MYAKGSKEREKYELKKIDKRKVSGIKYYEIMFESYQLGSNYTQNVPNLSHICFRVFCDVDSRGFIQYPLTLSLLHSHSYIGRTQKEIFRH